MGDAGRLDWHTLRCVSGRERAAQARGSGSKRQTSRAREELADLVGPRALQHFNIIWLQRLRR
eukprot:5964267-Pyramimonas_sp.AAC.1